MQKRRLDWDVRLWAVLATLVVGGCGDSYSDVLVEQTTRPPSEGGCVPPAETCAPNCLDAGACGAAQPICDPSEGCRACGSDDECPSESPRCTSEGACVECLLASDCTADSDARQCSAAGVCVECTSDSQCDEDEERCNVELGACLLPCSANGDCGSEDDDEEEDEDGLSCDEELGFCLECRTDEDCETGERCLRAECEDSF